MTPAPPPAGLLAALLAALAILPHLGGALHEPDEGRYAQIAWEMTSGGDWTVPRFRGREHLTKPPLAYWTAAAGLAVFGPSGLAATLGVALASLGSSLAIWRLGRGLFGPETGRRAALLFATSIYGFTVGHFLSADVLILCLQLGGLAAGVELWRGGSGRRRGLLACCTALAFALSFLAKGPPGLLALPALLWVSGRRHPQALRDLLRPGPLLLFFATALSWYLWTVLRDPERLRFFLVEEVWERLATDRHGRERSVFLYVAILVLGPIPWWTAQARGLRALARWWRAGRPPLGDGALLLGLWVLGSLALFFIARSRSPLYLGPPFAGLALLLAAASEAADAARPRRRLATAALLLWCAGLVLAHGLLRDQTRGGDLRVLGAAILRRAPESEGLLVDASGRPLCALGLRAARRSPPEKVSRQELLPDPLPFLRDLARRPVAGPLLLVLRREDLPGDLPPGLGTVLAGTDLLVLLEVLPSRDGSLPEPGRRDGG